MEEPSKLPLKRVEFSLTKFNDVAIPHHLDLLRQHKANILKYEEAGMWARVRSEQTHAARVASQLRGLLAQLDALRTQVQPQDHTRFDALTQRARDSTLRAIVDYLETSPLSINRSASCERDASPSGAPVGSVGAVSTDSVGVVAHATAAPDLLQLQVDEQELSLRERAAVLEGWCSLQSEVRALHSVWHSLHSTACAQRDAVTHADSNVTVAADNVQAARSHLSSAEKFRLSAAGAGGAALGALLGGPVGLLVGAKAGAAAMLAGSAAGYWAAALLGRRRRAQLTDTDAGTDTPADTHTRKDKAQ